jgi:hypothetical protein
MVGGLSSNNTTAPGMGGVPLNLASRNIAGVGKEDNSFYKSSKE